MTTVLLLLDLPQVVGGTYPAETGNGLWHCLYYCQTKQNHEHLKYFRNVNWVMTETHKGLIQPLMSLWLWPITSKIRTCKLAHSYFWLSFPKPDWLFPCITITFQRYFSCCSLEIPLSRPCKFSCIDFIFCPLFYLVPMQGLGTNATWVPKF